MGNRKSLPNGLAEKQELQRRETINRVLRAVADIKNEGGAVTISTLVEYTGLSRSTFAKPYIRELLKEYGYSSGKDMESLHNRKKSNEFLLIAEKERQIAKLRARNTELESECELLRGRLFLLMQDLGVHD